MASITIRQAASSDWEFLRNATLKVTPVTKHFALILAIFAVLHGALFLYGLVNSDSFLAGDRSIERMEKIAYVFDQDHVALGFAKDEMTLRIRGNENLYSRVIDSGHPGDYFFQGVFLNLGGVNAVLAFQLTLLLLSVVCIYSLALTLGQSHTTALIAAILYMFLPGSLIQPHQLSSESICNPIVAFSFYFIIAFFQGCSRYSSVVAGLFLLSLAMFIRPQFLLYPVILFLIFAVHYRHFLHPRVVIVIPLCFLLSAMWGGYALQNSGNMSVGSKEYGPQVALFETAKRMSVIGQYELKELTPGDNTMSMVEFSTHLLEHPSSFLTLKTHEIINLLFNPGVYSVAAHHLDFLAGGGDTDYWKQLRDQKGISGTLKEIMRRDIATVLLFFGGLAVWGGILLLMVAGCYLAARDPRITRTTKVIMLSYVCYGLLIVLVAGEGRWAHRTSVEFILVIFFAISVEQWHDWKRRVAADRSGVVELST